MLLQAGYDLENLARDWEFFRNEVQCSTDMVEQGHGVGACLMKHHESYCEATLRARSTVTQCRHFLSEPVSAKTEGLLRKKIAKLERSEPKIYGKQMYLKALHAEARAQRSELGVSQGSTQETVDIMRRHSSEFDHLPARKRQRFEADAAVERQRLRNDNERQLADLRAKLQVHLAGYTDGVHELDVGSHRLFLSAVETTRCAALFASFVQRRGAETCDRWSNARGGPLPPSLALQELLVDTAEGLGLSADIPCHWWVKHIAVNRDHFRGVAICDSPTSQTLHLALVALQRPYAVSFLELRRRPPPRILAWNGLVSADFALFRI